MKYEAHLTDEERVELQHMKDMAAFFKAERRRILDRCRKRAIQSPKRKADA